MCEIHRRRPRWKNVNFMIADYRRNLGRIGKMGTLSILQMFPRPSQTYREYLKFLVFISRQNLGQSGNSKIPDCLVFSRHIKTRLRKKSK